MSYTSEVLADSPLAYWRLGEASGTTLVDSSGNGRDGTYTSVTLGTAGLLTANSDTAATFNGTSTRAAVADAAWMDAANFTVEAVIKPSALTGNKAIISRDGASAPTRGWNLYLIGNKLGAADVALNLTCATTLIVGTTYHVALTFDGTTIRVYLNGVLDGSVGHVYTTTLANQVLIGASQAGAGGGPYNFFPGVMDEVAYYGSALSGARIAAHSAAVTNISGESFVSAAVMLDGSALTAISVAGDPFVAAATMLDGTVGGAPITVAGDVFTVATTMLDGVAQTQVLVGGESFASAATALDGAPALGPVQGDPFAVMITMLDGGVVFTSTTDTSNFYNGRRRGGLATVEIDVPVTSPPVAATTVRVDKAIAFPEPVLVKGRPT